MVFPVLLSKHTRLQNTTNSFSYCTHLQECKVQRPRRARPERVSAALGSFVQINSLTEKTKCNKLKKHNGIKANAADYIDKV